jgi:methylamine dehydrogenase accessory protein MauD
MNGWWLASYIVLWIITATMFVVLLVVLRQLGLIYLRGGGAPRLEEGPPIGAIVPSFEEIEDGTMAEIRFPDAVTDLNLLLFTSPHCRICEEVLVDLGELTRDFDARILVVSEGSVEENGRLRKLVDGGARFTSSTDRQRSLDVWTHPYGLVTDRTGTVLEKGLVNGWQDVQTLLEEAARSSRTAATPHGEEGGG